MANWPEVRLEDITSILGDGLHGTPTYDNNGEYFFINGNNLREGKIVFDEKTKRTPHCEYLKHKNDLNDRTILVSINGTLGNVAFFDDEKVFLGKSVCYFNVISGVDKQFVRYVISSRYFQDYINTYATGTTIKNVSLRSMRNFSFRLPPIEEQKRISRILSDQDQKIELNRQINQTLEQIAQAIFKSWFVDFEPVKTKQHIRALGGNDEQTERAAQAVIAGAVNLDVITTATDLSAVDQQLVEALNEKLAHQTDAQRDQLAATASYFPDQLVESELGLIPEGWSVDRAARVADVAIGKTPPRKEPQWFSVTPRDMKWVSIRDMGNAGVYQTTCSEYLTYKAVEKFNVRKIPDNTVLLSFKLTVGRVAITVGEMTSNEAIAHFKLAAGASVTTEYLYQYLKGFNYDNLGSTSSIATAVNSTMIKEMPVLVPSGSVIAVYTKAVAAAFSSIRLNQHESDSLSEARDALLPQLLSGDIRVAD